MTSPISREHAPHYIWAEGCEGWRLADTEGLSVIEERVPPGATETRHYHRQARQFFYVLVGVGTLEIEGKEVTIPAGSGLEVAPGLRHTFHNRSTDEVRFLVISSPSTKHDRIEVR